MGEFNVNKSDGSLERTAGMPSEYPATQVMMSDGVTSVEDAIGNIHFKTFKYTYTGATSHGTILSISNAKSDVFSIPASANVVGIAWQNIQGNQRYVSTRPSYDNDTLLLDPDATNSALLIFSGVVMYT